MNRKDVQRTVEIVLPERSYLNLNLNPYEKRKPVTTRITGFMLICHVPKRGLLKTLVFPTRTQSSLETGLFLVPIVKTIQPVLSMTRVVLATTLATSAQAQTTAALDPELLPQKTFHDFIISRSL